MARRALVVTSWAAVVGLVLYGLMALATPSALMDTFTDNIYSFPHEATRALEYQTGLYRLLGYLNMILGLAGAALLLRYRSRRDEWALWFAAALAFVGYVGPVTFDLTVGVVGPFEYVEFALLGGLAAAAGAAWLARSRSA